MPDKLLGQANEAEVSVSGHQCTALLDTGSTVSTVSQSFYDQYLSEIHLFPLGDLLNLEGAGGHRIPYLGYIETTVGIPGEMFEQEAILLVVPDTGYSEKVPVLLGTNILVPFMECQAKHYGIWYMQRMKLGTPWQLVFRCINLQDKNLDKSGGRLCLVKNVGNKEIHIPANNAVTVQGVPTKQISYRTCTGMTVAAKGEASLQDLEVTPTLINYSLEENGTIPVLISNPTTQTRVIPPHALLCEVHQASPDYDVLSKGVPSSSDPDWIECLNLEDSLLSEKEKEDVYKFLSEWKDIFSQNDLDIGFTSLVKHTINLVDETPFKQRHRRIPPSMYSEVRKHLQQRLDADIIRPSHSPWASNMVLVRKKDNSIRVCVDYRQLNRKTIKDAYYLPRIDEMLESLSGNKYFSILDMKSGYHQLEVLEAHKPRTAFTAGPLGFWEYNRLPFGLCNAPATYQRVMEECLGELNYSICLVYLDDLIIFSKTYEEQVLRLRKVFEKLREHGLKLSPKKCHLFKEKVKYVGHIISKEGIEPDPEKISKVATWPRPTNADEVRQFLGFAGYYRKFIKDFSKIARPLNNLLEGQQNKKKRRVRTVDIAWKWTSEHDESFQLLKDKLTSPPILGYPNFSLPFELHVDASGEALGAVLNQEQEGKMRVIAFASRGLSKTEKNYSAYKLEFLALKWAISEKFNDYLYGSEFTVLTDNNPLTYVLTNAKLDATGHRWLAALANYDFNIKYRPGVKTLMQIVCPDFQMEICVYRRSVLSPLRL